MSFDGSALCRGWARFIRSVPDWGWFLTGTFAQDVSVTRAEAVLDPWYGRLAEACRRKWESTGQPVPDPMPLPTAVAVIEPTHQLRPHLHALIKHPMLSRLPRVRWGHAWERADWAAGMARVYPAGKRAIPYLAKYLSKSSGGTIILRGNFAGWPTSEGR